VIDELSLSCVSMQLDNADEQAAQVRRELDARLQASDDMLQVSDRMAGSR